MRCKTGTLLLLCMAWLSPAIAEPLLPPCPDSPNCVSSLASNERHAIAALQAGDSAESARTALIALLDSLPRVTWTGSGEQRLHAAFTTRLLRFTDDVDFYLRSDGHIEVRSASRTGYYDFGTNRRRVEALRNALQNVQRQTGPADAP